MTSPYSSTSDITHFLTSTYGRSVLKSPIGMVRTPISSPVPPGESQVGRLIHQSLSSQSLNQQLNDGNSNTLIFDSPTKSFPLYMKTIKQQLWDELLCANEERRRLIDWTERDLQKDKDYYRRSETDLYNLEYSPLRGRGLRRRGRRNFITGSDSKLAKYDLLSPRDELGLFKSYESFKMFLF